MFEIGNRVILTSNQYGSSQNNPFHEDYPDVMGTIIDIDYDEEYNEETDEYYNVITNIRVNWSNERTNDYSEETLSLYTSFKQKYKINEEVLLLNGTKSTIVSFKEGRYKTLSRRTCLENELISFKNKVAKKLIKIKNIKQRKFAIFMFIVKLNSISLIDEKILTYKRLLSIKKTDIEYSDNQILKYKEQIDSLKDKINKIKKDNKTLEEDELELIKNIQENITSYTIDTLRYNESIKSIKQSIIDINQQMKDIKKDKKININKIINESLIQYEHLSNNEKILSFSLVKNYLIITTKDLLYTDKRKGIEGAEMGAFKIYIKNEKNQFKIGAINYKFHLLKDYCHPCVLTSSTICMGENVASEIKKQYNENNIDMIFFTLINFLEESNYGTPYQGIKSFLKFKQVVTINPKKESNWFNKLYWQKNEKWDYEEYNKKQKENDQPSSITTSTIPSTTISTAGTTTISSFSGRT